MSVAERLAALAPDQRALLEKLWEKQRKAAPPRSPPIPRRSGATGAGDWPLSLDQERFWFMEQLYPGGAGLHITAATRMRGPLAVPALAAALGEIVRRHASWRTTFPMVEGRPVQRVAPARNVRRQALGVLDLAALPGDRREAEALRLVGEATAAPFDLENGPLMRAGLVRMGADDHVCLLTVHHLVTDFLSFEIAFGELAEILLWGGAGGSAVWLPEPPVQYSDFAVWQREWLQGDVLDGLVSWWRERLEGFPLALELPTDRPRPAVLRLRGGRRRIAASRELSEGLRDLARREGVTLFMAVLAATAALLHRAGAQEKLILGANNANRNRPEIEPVLGCFLTQVPFPIDLGGDPAFRELLARVRQSALGAFAHQDLPFGKLVEALQPVRDTSRQPLIQTLVQVLDSGPTSQVSLGGVSFEAVDAWDGVARYDLMLTLFDHPDGLVGSLEYDADLFDATTAERLVEMLLLQAETAAADPGVRVSDLPVLTEAARHQVRVEWNEAAQGGGFPASVLPLLEARIAERPEAVALSGGGETLTYGELGRRSGRLARRLRGLGLGPEDRVGLLLERSPAVAVAILGVWKAGAACVPLDPGLPEERLAWMMADAGLAALVSDGPRPGWGVPVLGLEDARSRGLPPPDLTPPAPLSHLPPSPRERGELTTARAFRDQGGRGRPSPGGWVGDGRGVGGEVGRGEAPTAMTLPSAPTRLAYLIYTSGTTGRPKAVMVEHGSLAQTLVGCLRRFGSGPDDLGQRMPHLAPFSFDISLFELLVPLLAGGQVEVLTRADILDLARLAASLRDATWLHGVPSLLRKLADHLRETGEAPDLRTVFVGGERVPPDLLRDLRTTFPSAEIVVLYGPTETAILCAAWMAGDVGEAGERSLLGRPLPGVELHLLDHRRNPVPIGVPGELHVGGAGVARGYHGRPDLTADRFRPDRFGARLYRTGDLARLLPDGVIEFLGRTDHQVKLRGFRIEPGEIEAALLDHPAVREAVVVADGEEDGKRLIAYVTPAGLEPASLRQHLAERLPAYMVPAAFVVLPELPLTAHAKVDRARLPAPERPADEAGEAPRTPAEEVVAGIWCEVLGVPRISRTDNFFDLGGHSLLATQVVSRLRAATGAELAVRELFQAPTVAALAAALEASLSAGVFSAGAAAAPPIRPVPRDRALPLSFAQERLWFLDRLVPGISAYHIPLAVALRGVLVPEALESALGEVVARHESLRTRFGERERRAVQIVDPPGARVLPRMDLSSLPDAQRAAESLRLAGDEAGRPFDLARGPVLRSLLLRLEPAEHVLLLCVHHIAADGWSLGVMIQEISAFYRAAVEGGAAGLPGLPVQYADFAVWQREWLQGEVLERQLGYWRERLAGAPALDLPTDRPRPAVQSFRGAVETLALPPERAAGLARLARRHDATPFMVLLVGLQALLARHTGQDDIVVGSPIANRNRAEIEPLIGFFVNTLVLRGDLSGDPAFSALIAGARRTALEAFSHQDLPFERLVEEMRPERRLSLNPLFQVILAVQNAPLREVELPGLSLAPLDLDFPVTRFDLEVMVWELDGGLTLQLIYDTELFDQVTIERLAGRLDRLLATVVEESELRISALPLLAAAERRELLLLGSGAEPEPGPDLLDRIAAQAARAPRALAVSSASGRLTYGELAAGASRLAGALRDLGVGPDVPVGLHVERSPELVLGALAVLLAGGAYVPLDPSHPEERLAFMVRESGMPVLLSGLLARGAPPVWAGEARVVGIDLGIAGGETGSNQPPVRCAPDHLAYVIHTSGSTGRPKGVQVPRRGLLALVDWHLQAYEVTERDRATLVASPSFDASVWEIWPYLAAGASLHVPDEETRLSPGRLLAWMAAEEITLAFLPTPLAEPFVERAEEGLPEGFALRALLTGGDRLRRAPRRPLPFALVNHYGPTESSVVAIWAPVPAGGELPPAIGRPVDGTRVVILDGGLDGGLDGCELAPAGVPGELAIGGAGLARGYLGRPDLTAERFVPDPWAGRPGERIYRTGDRVRWRTGGSLEFLGRIDRQVKLRGFRIEPGEIEDALRRHPRVREAVVTVRDDGAGGAQGGRHLVAYVVPRPAAAAAPGQGEASLHISHWQELYDETYGRGPAAGGAEDPSFNIQGWNSSYTGEPIPAEEMREWQEGTVDRLLALPHRRVIEVGCGTGLLLFRIAPHAERYRGTDFSAVALAQVQAGLGHRALPQVELAQGLADDWTGVSPGDFELVVLNSVVQYFPGVDYLVRVLEGAVAAVAPGGAVFVGDVRSLPLLEAFHTSVQLHRAPGTLPVAELARRIRRRIADEEELVVDPALFLALARLLPQVSRVQILMKRGRHANELTRFRYDVVLHVGPGEGEPTDTPDVFHLSGLPDARLAAEAAALELLESAGREMETVEELRAEIDRRVRASGAVDPEDLWTQAERLGYDAELTASEQPGRFDAVLRRRGAGLSSPPNLLGGWGVPPPDLTPDPSPISHPPTGRGAPPPAQSPESTGSRKLPPLPGAGWEMGEGGRGGEVGRGNAGRRRELELEQEPGGESPDRPWTPYANDPLSADQTRRLVPELRHWLEAELPEPMVPSAFVLLDALPLTPSGKVDRAALPAPERIGETAETWVAPATPLEQTLARVAAEVLGLDQLAQIGMRDNFFELGGHSLLATQLVSRLSQDHGLPVTLQMIFDAATLADLAEQIVQKEQEEGTEAPAARIPRRPLDLDPVPASFAQERLLFLDRLAPGNTAYNIPMALHIQGDVSPAVLEAVLGEVVRRHEALRTTFGEREGRPVQIIAPPGRWTLPVADLSGLPAAVRAAESLRLAREEADRPFDLAREPLLRAVLVGLGAAEHALLLGMHHIVSDGWSMGVLVREITALYGNTPLPELPIQYADFAIWQREWLQGEERERQTGYWREKLAGVPASLDLPTDRPRPADISYRGARLPTVLGADFAAGLGQLARRHEATPFMVLLAGFQALLSCLTRQEDLAVGSPIANRNRAEIEPLIGFFVNTLVMRGDLSGDPDFRGLLARVRRTTLEAYAHQDLPFEMLVEELRPERHLSLNPLFQVLCSLQNAPVGRMELPGLTLAPIEIAATTAQFDLELSVMETPETADALLAVLSYSTDLFDEPTVMRLAGHLETLLRGAMADPGRRVAELPLLSGGERHQLLREWTDTRRAEAPGGLLERFAEQVERTPDRLAAVWAEDGTGLTYRELNRRANQLAHHLQALGVGPDERVAICLERSLAPLIAVLAVLKAGGAYVPIDPDYPADRVAFLLADSRSRVLITTSETAARLPRVDDRARLVLLDAHREILAARSANDPEFRTTPQSLAYVIYTSGSTGRPKGVGMPHGALANLLSWQCAASTAGQGRRTLQYASLSFDASFQEIFSTWWTGGTMVALPQETRRDAVALCQVLAEQEIERLFVPFVALQQIAEAVESGAPAPAALLEIVTAGEQLRITRQIAAWLERSRAVLENHYGPTEGHVVTVHRLAGRPGQWPALPPIGRPLPNLRMVLLDRHFEPVPQGVAGHLCFGGAQVVRGYLDRPELTAERFLPDPFSGEPGSRLYATGDQARYLADGTLQFLGRIDQQVKVRGFRVEPGEIEMVLRSHPSVRDCVVLARNDVLVAWTIGGPDAAALRSFLGERLPDYMVPSAFVRLDALPLTPSGKVDRKALPAPEWTRDAEHLGPRDVLELELARIWEEVLDVRPVGVRDDFFRLGGHSLLAVQVTSRIQSRLGRGLPLASLLRHPTVERLAAHLREEAGPVGRAPLVELASGDGTPLFLVHPAGGEVLCYVPLARRLDRPVHGLQAPEEPLPLEELAALHLRHVREVQPDGPYLLGGWSLGGAVAFEMARQLERQGEAVERVVLIDSFAPGDLWQKDIEGAALVALFANDLARLLGIGGVALPEGFADRSVEDTLAWLAARAEEAGLLTPGLGAADLERRFAIFATQHHAMVRYKGGPCAAPLLLIRAAEPDSGDPDRGWGRLTGQKVEVHELPGDHYTLLREPAVERLAALVRERIGAPEPAA